MGINRGDIFIVDFSLSLGCEQTGERPALVIQNNTGNKFSPTIIVAAISTKVKKCDMPTHVHIDSGLFGLQRASLIMLEQIRTVDRKRLLYKIGSLDKEYILKIDRALKKSIGL